MAISYVDSLKQSTKSKTSKVYQPIAENSPNVYGSENWTLDSRYKYCPEYQDNNIVVINGQKSVSAQTDKIVVTQGSNSEFVPFELDRYYDGFDLYNTIITIHFLNKNGFDDYAAPINVYYSDDKIRLGWLIDNRVTAVEGIIQFEIEAVGKNSGGDKYEWRTKPSDCISVLKSISGNGPIKPGSNWVTDLVERIQNTESEIEEIKSNIGNPSGTVVVEVDPTLTKDGMAADAKAVGDAIKKLPISVSEEDGYTDIYGLRQPIRIDIARVGNAVTMDIELQGGVLYSNEITLSDEGLPVTIVSDGISCEMNWSGFEMAVESISDALDEINGEVI